MESGESAEVLQKILGHPKITLTINPYSHLSPRYQKEPFGRLGESFGRRKPARNVVAVERIMVAASAAPRAAERGGALVPQIRPFLR